VREQIREEMSSTTEGGVVGDGGAEVRSVEGDVDDGETPLSERPLQGPTMPPIVMEEYDLSSGSPKRVLDAAAERTRRGDGEDGEDDDVEEITLKKDLEEDDDDDEDDDEDDSDDSSDDEDADLLTKFVDEEVKARDAEELAEFSSKVRLPIVVSSSSASSMASASSSASSVGVQQQEAIKSSSNNNEGANDEENDVIELITQIIPPYMSCRSVDCYERLNSIEEGSYGMVFRARDYLTGEIFALKKVKMNNEKEGFPKTSLREIKILTQLKHPNLLHAREIVVGSSLDSVFIVFEFLDHDLRRLMMAMKSPFLISEVKCLMLQVRR